MQVYHRKLLANTELQAALETFGTHKLHCHTGKISEKDTPNVSFEKNVHWADLEIAEQVVSATNSYCF